MIHIFKHRKGQTYEQIKLAKNRLFLFTCFNPLSPNSDQLHGIFFWLTISIQGQEIRFLELIKLSPKRKCFDLLSNSLNLSF